MKLCWQILLLDCLESLDRQESPHGIYGLRQAYSTNGRLPTLAHLFSSAGSTNILRPCGLKGKQSRYDSDDLRFGLVTGECISLRVLDYATTKVRLFGSAYRLDDHQTKKSEQPNWDLESLIPKLPASSQGALSMGILLVIHYPLGEIMSVLGRSTNPEFLSRYQVAHFDRLWEDRHKRGFQTALHLWTPQTQQ